MKNLLFKTDVNFYSEPQGQWAGGVRLEGDKKEKAMGMEQKKNRKNKNNLISPRKRT